LQRLTEVQPDSPEAWYDFAALKASLGKPADALPALRRSFELGDARSKTNPAIRNMRTEAERDQRFDLIKQTPEFKQIIGVL
jgi:hypothetical protein